MEINIIKTIALIILGWLLLILGILLLYSIIISIYFCVKEFIFPMLKKMFSCIICINQNEKLVDKKLELV